MKVFILLVAIGVASAAICDNAEGKKGDIPALSAKINEFLAESDVFKHCAGAFNDIIANEACNSLYEEGFCYFNVGSVRYAELNLDNVADELTFDLIKAGVPDAASYGQNLCDNAAVCVKHAKSVGMKCMENPDFLIAVSVGAEDLLTKAKAQLEQLAAENEGTVIGRVSNLILEKLGDQNVADLKSKAEDYSDQYEESKGKAIAFGQEFCAAGCVQETANSLTNAKGTGVLDHLIRAKSCKRPAAFCEGCVKPAKTHFKKKGIPCCLTTVINAGLKKFDYLQNKYGAKVDKFVKGSTEDEKLIYQSVRKQLKCYRRSYENAGDCISA